MLELVSDPEIEAVTLAQMKRELGAFDQITSRDDDITAKIKAAREWVEDFTGRVLVDETWRLSIERSDLLFMTYSGARISSGSVPPTRDVYLRRSPAIAITSFVTVDANGVETAVAAADYELRDADSRWPLVVPIGTAIWGASNIRVTFRAGFADQTGSPQTGAEVVPERFKQAMILWVKANYDDDPAAMAAAENLAKPLRAHVGFA
ncbi:MAG: hypothetical protein ACTS5I_10825 [Rhodanobacter sp.]